LGDCNSRIEPEKIIIDFKDEDKKLKKLKKQHKSLEEVEELLTLHSFVKSATNTNTLGKQFIVNSLMEQD
jgi:hypothetical protein